jgi:3-deoxy-manno-octulosonate cytidylyltransferase (CMP-KDO synthetase)
MLKAVVVIPARFNSTRFPGKPLALLREKPLIQHVYEGVSSADLIDTVFIATDDKRVFDVVTGFGAKAIMTSSEHTCGTDRVAEVVRDIDCEIVVNVQGDEPFIRSGMVDDVVRLLVDDPRASIGTLAKKTSNIEEILSPDIVKVVMDNEGFAMYFSRAPIPYHRDEFSELRVTNYGLQAEETRTHNPQPTTHNMEFYKHIGIYGYRKDALLRFASMKKSRLEQAEKLEQLRALFSGMKIKVKETAYDTFGIDTIEDLRKAEKWLNLSL